jgi:hypothetical protein
MEPSLSPLIYSISSRLKPIMRSHGFDPLYPEKKGENREVEEINCTAVIYLIKNIHGFISDEREREHQGCNFLMDSRALFMGCATWSMIKFQRIN